MQKYRANANFANQYAGQRDQHVIGKRYDGESGEVEQGQRQDERQQIENQDSPQ
jgi:hypothetical protein